VFDADALVPVVAGQDAAVVALGGGRKGGVRARGTAAVVEAMRRTGVRRLVVQSTLGVGDSRGNLNFFWKHLMFGLLLRNAYADHVEQEELTRQSGLDWTIVRPGAFTDGARTGSYRRGFSAEERTNLRISRADVADFVVSQLTDDTWLRRTPAVAYG
jgi:putative NADH-flavin reductase